MSIGADDIGYGEAHHTRSVRFKDSIRFCAAIVRVGDSQNSPPVKH